MGLRNKEHDCWGESKLLRNAMPLKGKDILDYQRSDETTKTNLKTYITD